MSLRLIMRRRRIAILVLLAMVFNQVAFAAHLCLDTLASPQSTPVAATALPEAVAQTECHGSRPAADTRDHSHAGCPEHCAHATDGNQQAKVPVVPALARPSMTYAATPAACTAAMEAAFFEAAGPPVERRLTVFVSLLI